MRTKAETEVIRRVWWDGHCLEIGDCEVPEFLELRTTGKNAEYFGQLNLSLSADAAMALGESLIACAREKMIENAPKK